MSSEMIFSCEGICKNFGPTRALKNVGIEVCAGDVIGLIGENGSGKSTLTSIIAGTQKADSGTMMLHGKAYKPSNMLEAQKHGIGMIVQETGVLPGLTVAENVFVGNTERFSKCGIVDVKRMNEEADAILKSIGADDINSAAPIESLNFEDRKIVEIARAMYQQPNILIIDESTTALAQKGREIIYGLINKMQADKKAVIFISHDLYELMQVCNTITVLRDGIKIDTLDKERMSIATMRRLMVGRELTDNYYRLDYDGSCSDKLVLKASRISSQDGMIVNLDIELHEGEILGLGGLANSGMHELGRMLCGISKPITGEVVHVPTGTVLKNQFVSIKHSVGYISKDRDLESLILNASIKENVVMPSLGNLSRRLFISGKSEKRMTQQQIDALSIKCTGANQFCTGLSGGNKQKVALGKWLAYDSDVLIMDCPTRGIDIGVKAAIYSIMQELKKAGKSIVMISEELVELIGMSDRMLIMKDGKISAELSRSETLKESDIIEYMI